jgi:hypothetical protein
LLDPEFEKQRRQHQRRNNEKETEVQKVLPKIRCATRSRLSLISNSDDLKSHQLGIQRLSQSFPVVLSRQLISARLNPD